MTERELIVPLRQERELQRRVKELEEALKQAIEELRASYGRSRLMPDNTCESINRWESLLSNSKEPAMTAEERVKELEEALKHEFARGRLFQFERMKMQRPADPVYWDMHEENSIRESLLSNSGAPKEKP